MVGTETSCRETGFGGSSDSCARLRPALEGEEAVEVMDQTLALTFSASVNKVL